MQAPFFQKKINPGKAPEKISVFSDHGPEAILKGI